MPEPKTLDEAYSAYTTGKYFGRRDMFKMLVDKVNELEARIGAVDEAAVEAMKKRLEAHEIVVGNALRYTPHGPSDEAQPVKRGPGRPRKSEQMEAAHV